MRIRTLSAATLCLTLCLTIAIARPADAATVSIYDSQQELLPATVVADLRYRVSRTGWDQMLSNAAARPSARDLTTAGLGNARQLNGLLWDFSVSYESGDDGARGFTFTMGSDDYRRGRGPGNSPAKPYSSTLLFDVQNPLNDITPWGSFNTIQLEARAGALRGDAGKAMLAVTGLNFYAGTETTALKDLNAATAARSSEWSSYWVSSNKDLSTFDWTVTGMVQGSFACADGTDRCLRDESLKMNMRFAEVDTVPVPAAAWLFLSALGALALKRRSRSN